MMSQKTLGEHNTGQVLAPYSKTTLFFVLFFSLCPYTHVKGEVDRQFKHEDNSFLQETVKHKVQLFVQVSPDEK